MHFLLNNYKKQLILNGEIMKRLAILVLIAFAITSYELPAQSPYDDFPDYSFPIENRGGGVCCIVASVILYDLDADGYLDLLKGNYYYPWMSGFSLFGIKPAIHWNESGNLQGSTSMINQYICVDCIAVGDYNSDGKADVLLGKVAMQGGDGADELWSYDASHTFTSSNWPSESHDTHAIQWVDVDADGDLDIAALDVSRNYVHFYLNDYPSDNAFADDPDFSLPIRMRVRHPIKGDDLDDFAVMDSALLSIYAADLEFGDINGDGFLDCFVDRHFTSVYLHRGAQYATYRPYDEAIVADAHITYENCNWVGNSDNVY